MRKIWMIMVLLTLLQAACSASAPQAEPVAQQSGSSPKVAVVVPTEAPTPTPAEELPVYSAVGLESLAGYHSTLSIRMQGEYEWNYALETSKNEEQIEHVLHIEGVSQKFNPGDVRFVSDGETSWMRGPGTEDQCVRFPNDMDLGPVFLTPKELLAPEMLQQALVYVGEEELNGHLAAHFTAQVAEFEGWQNLQMDVWIDPEGKNVVQYKVQGTVEDPLFNAGVGLLTANFRVLKTGQEDIIPIEGCELDLPLALDASRLIQLPGLATYESPQTREALVAFYQDALATQGWLQFDLPQNSEDTTLLSYMRDGKSLDIKIEQKADKTRVDLITLE